MDRLQKTGSNATKKLVAATVLSGATALLITTLVMAKSSCPGKQASACEPMPAAAPITEQSDSGSHLSPPPSAPGSFLIRTRGYEVP